MEGRVREGSGREGKKELRCVIYLYKLSKMNVTILYCKNVLLIKKVIKSWAVFIISKYSVSLG